MSGIYGIYRYDGAPVDPQWIERMRKAMAYYGPDGGGCKIAGPVGMGHLLLEVNPEDAFERQPMRCRRGLVVTSVRLDNREALLDTFEIPSSEAPQVSDGHLVSLAFDRWGEEVCTHLEGDWALAAWDAKERRLLLARDIFGIAALYYYQGKGFIAFASSMKALLALPGVRKEPDELRLAEILTGWPHDVHLTAYKGFRSLVNAHTLVAGPDGSMTDRRFWSPEGREPIRYLRDEDYVEAFLEHYTRAVKSCLRTQKPIAAELSGGRDSGSVVAMTAPLLACQGRELTAYTSVPCFSPDWAGPKHNGNEWDLAHATATMAGTNVRHVPIDAEDYNVIETMEHYFEVHDSPCFAASNLYWIRAILETCSKSGERVILTGQRGNTTISWEGNGSAVLALLQGRPATAIRLLLHGEATPWFALKRQVLKPLLKPGIVAFRRSMASPSQYWCDNSALSAQMAEKLDIHGRIRAAGYNPSFMVSPLEDFRQFLFRPEYGIGSTTAADAFAWHSIACLDPTANFSLLEFLLRVPDDQFYLRGERNFLIKRAFQDRMPRAVLNPNRRGLQAADVGHRILRELPRFQQCLDCLESVPEAREMLDLQRLNQCLTDLVAKVDPITTTRAASILARGVGVGLFLHQLADSNSSSAPRPC